MFRFAPLRGAVLSCLAKKVPKEGAAGGTFASAASGGYSEQ